MSDDVFKDGEAAERLLVDPAFVKAMQRLENDAVFRWKAAKTVEQREEIHATLRAVASIRDSLDAMKGDKRYVEGNDKLYGRKKG